MIKMTEDVLRLNLRLRGEEARKIRLVLERSRQRNKGQISLTAIAKELLFLHPPYLLNADDREILRHGTSMPQLDGAGTKRDRKKGS